MSERQGFLDAIRADLDDDTPRLIYADWLDDNGDGERAALIRFGVAAGAGFSLTPSERRAGTLSPGASPAVRFRRGFVEQFSADSTPACDAAVKAHPDELLSEWISSAAALCDEVLTHPLVAGCDRAELTIDAPEQLDALGRAAGGLRWRSMGVLLGPDAGGLSEGRFPRVERLEVRGTGTQGPASPFGFARACPALRRFELPQMRPGPPLVGPGELDLPHLEGLALDVHGWGERDGRRLAQTLALGRLRWLKLDGIHDTWHGAATGLGRGRVEVLELGRCHNTGALACGPALPKMGQVRRLVVGNHFADAGPILGRGDALPALEELRLVLDDARLAEPMLKALADGGLLSRLRSLEVASAAPVTSLTRRLASGVFPGLTALDLRGCGMGPDAVAELAKLDAPLERLLLPRPGLPLTPAVVNALGRAPWAKTVQALSLGNGGRNKAVRAAAVKQFGPRCDEYWLGDRP